MLTGKLRLFHLIYLRSISQFLKRFCANEAVTASIARDFKNGEFSEADQI